MDERCAMEIVHLGRLWAAADAWKAKGYALAVQMGMEPDAAEELSCELHDATHTWMSLLNVMLNDYATRDFEIPAVDDLMFGDDAEKLRRIMAIGDEAAWLRELPNVYDWSLFMLNAFGNAVREAANSNRAS